MQEGGQPFLPTKPTNTNKPTKILTNTLTMDVIRKYHQYMCKSTHVCVYSRLFKLEIILAGLPQEIREGFLACPCTEVIPVRFERDFARFSGELGCVYYPKCTDNDSDSS